MRIVSVLVGLGVASVLLSGCTNSTGTAAPTTPSAARSDVDVSIVTAIGGDGTVEWLEAKLVPATSDNTKVEAVAPERKQSSKLAADASFLTPTGCTSTHVDISLDPTGTGMVKCARVDYLRMGPGTHYAPKMSFNQQGEITRIADRYHP